MGKQQHVSVAGVPAGYLEGDGFSASRSPALKASMYGVQKKVELETVCQRKNRMLYKTLATLRGQTFCLSPLSQNFFTCLSLNLPYLSPSKPSRDEMSIDILFYSHHLIDL